MGNLHSRDGVPSLDELGGYYRPAVARKNELDIKSNWLGKAVLAQADHMETELQLRNFTDKEVAMMATGGPRRAKSTKRLVGFGHSADEPASPSGRLEGGSRQGPRPSSVKSQNVLRNSDPGPLQPTKLAAGAQQLRASAQAPLSKLGSAAKGAAYANVQGLGPAARRNRVAAAAAAKAAKVADEQFRANHWRKRVDAAKRRLYLYLVAYMAWMSVLRKKRSGYADPLPVDVLPLYLSSVLGELMDQVGEQLGSCEGLGEVKQAQAQATAITGGRMWLNRVRQHEGGSSATAGAPEPPGGPAAALSSRGSLPSALVPAATFDAKSVSSCPGALPVTPAQKATALGNLAAAFSAQRGAASPSNHAPGSSAAPGTWPHAPTNNLKVAWPTAGALSPTPPPEAHPQPATAAPTAPSGRLASRQGPRGGARALVSAGAGVNALQQSPTHQPLRPGTTQGRAGALGFDLSPMAKRPSTAAVGDAAAGFGAGRVTGVTPRKSGAAALQEALSVYGRASKASVTASAYAKEVDAVRRITALYLMKGARGAAQGADVSGMLKQQAQSLQMLANRANARWVEKHMADTRDSTKGGWNAPIVLDAKTLAAGGVDINMYKQMPGTLLAEGKVALMLTYLGEEQPASVNKYNGAEVTQPAIQCDPWKAVQQLFAHKLPSSPYISGLTLLDRRVLQAVLDVEKQGGAAALGQLVVLLAVDGQHTAWVAEQLVARSWWGLQPHQVLVISIARLPGMLWEAQTKTFKLSFSDPNSYMSAGSGYAMLALAWPSHAFYMTQQGREYVAGSVLQLLSKRNVQYLYSTMMTDLECLTPACPAVDPALAGPAIYAMDLKGANMAMQVCTTSTDQYARQTNSLVLAPAVGSLFCSSIALTDVQAVSTRPLLTAQLNASSVISSMFRYFIQLSHLQSILKGPNAFHIKAEVNMPCMYVSLDTNDLTSHPASHCVAVMSKGRPPHVHVTSLSRDWLRDAVPMLTAQDAQPALRIKVSRLHAAAPTSVVSGSAVAAGAASIASAADTRVMPSPRGSGSTLLLFVRDNNASRTAFRLALALCGGRDVLHVVTVLAPGQGEAAGRQLLASFSDAVMDHHVRRKVVLQRDKLLDTLVGEVETYSPSLVVMGSELLSQQADSKFGGRPGTAGAALGGGLSTSATLSLVKSLVDVPLLVVKTNSAGELLQGEATGPRKVVALEVTTASLPLLKWLAPRMKPDKDRLLLVRPNGLDKATGQETPVCQRMMQAFQSEANTYGFTAFTAKRTPLAEGPDAYTGLVAREKCDLLALMCPTAKVTPSHVIDLLKSARTNILIWRQQGSGQ